MIEATERRLTIRFALVLVAFTVLVLAVVYLYFRHNVMDTLQRHVLEEIQNEFIDQFHRTGLDTVKASWESYRFQILNQEGDIIVGSRSAPDFYPALNRDLLGQAFAGEKNFETLVREEEPYLVAYFPLSEKYAGRIAAPLGPGYKQQKAFLRLILIMLPGLLIFSLLVGRYLVKAAIKPIADVFTFQEHFSSSVSHELRSPLASLKGNLEVSLRKERSIDEYRETIRFSLTEVNRIIDLLNDLFLLASARFKPLDLFKEQVDISEMMGELVTSYSPRLKEREVSIEQSVPPGLRCICDGALVKRVFENILNNALKYTPGGGTIRIGAFEAMGKMLVNVANTAAGISKEEVSYFFEPFYRGRNVTGKNFEGKGLGLFIARYIVRSHGGDISAKILKDGTFSITVSLPVR